MVQTAEGRARFDAYAAMLAKAVGHADRREPVALYCQGLILPGDRKSVEPMAARLDPLHVQARHQSLHHLVAKAGWSDAAVLRVARNHAREAMEIQGPLEAWIVDDTAFPKKGTHSVGVAHQDCGPYGKTSNCQNAVSVSLASRWASVPVAFRLYLPERWAKDQERRTQAGVPPEVRFQTKWQIALALIDAQREDGEPDRAHFPFPEDTAPFRPERHSSYSITTLRRRLERVLVGALAFCPTCGRNQCA